MLPSLNVQGRWNGIGLLAVGAHTLSLGLCATITVQKSQLACMLFHGHELKNTSVSLKMVAGSLLLEGSKKKLQLKAQRLSYIEALEEASPLWKKVQAHTHMNTEHFPLALSVSLEPGNQI